ncbi:MAG: tRNA dihydrouridine synthase DusB [Desulfobacteraceae bacterium]|jgi:nifR3 family TIM-barrel protein|nr:MAG: tRNA dihydrouridine synthase DusB [Desulfobacteraceae bacterium]
MLTIGNLKLDGRLLMAPMAGITNLPFRIIAKRCGAALVTTEMISSKGLVLNQRKTVELLSSVPSERPLAVQIFGSDPDTLAEAAVVACDAGADLVDINMGCPVKKVIKTGAGGALLQNPVLVERILSRVRKKCPVPLTAKIRIGWSKQENCFHDVLLAIEAGGADCVTVHPRYVVQGFSGLADWSYIAFAKKTLGIPVIGNGDVTNSFMVSDMINRTGCDGVMVGRAAVWNPWIFSTAGKGGDEGSGAPALTFRKELIKEHCRLLCEHIDGKRAAFIMRGVLSRYTKGLGSSTTFREKISHLSTPAELMNAFDDFFSRLTGVL